MQTSRIKTLVSAAMAVIAFSLCARFAQAQSSGFTVDTSSRTAVQDFYNNYYLPGDDVPSGWNGDVSNGIAGTISSACENAILQRINWFRAMAGLPTDVALNSTWNNKCQQMALMMSANENISHSPDASWTYYTADGAEAASKSNLSLGSWGVDSISRLIRDTGSNNTALGHRRWLLYPPANEMGIGTIPGDVYSGYSSLCNWVIGGWASSPPASPAYVTWPPAGYVPEEVVFARWSFGMKDADLSSATVSMTKNGQSISTTLYPYEIGFGDNTIGWLPEGFTASESFLGPDVQPLVQAAADVTYSVTVANVGINGGTQDYTYDVIVFTPSDSGDGGGTPTPTPTVSPTDPPAITSKAKKKCFKNSRCRYKIKATNSPTSYALSGTLPRKLKFNETKGVIKGKAKQQGAFDVVLTASNANGSSDPFALLIKVRKPKKK